MSEEFERDTGEEEAAAGEEPVAAEPIGDGRRESEGEAGREDEGDAAPEDEREAELEDEREAELEDEREAELEDEREVEPEDEREVEPEDEREAEPDDECEAEPAGDEHGAPVPRRRRAAPVALGLAALVAVAVLALVALNGGGEQPPATGAARLVPAGALVYVNVSTDGERAGTRRALSALGRFALARALAARLIGTLNATGRGIGVDYTRDIAPWIGGDAALALLDSGGSIASSEIVVAVRNPGGAREFLARLGGPGVASSYHGVKINAYGSQALAFVGGYLVLAPPANVRLAIDRSQGRGRPLAADPAYARATAGAPTGRYADAYASADGVRRVLAGQGGAVGALGALLAQPGLQGVDISFTVAGSQAKLRVHSALAPPARGAPSRSRPFAPTLARLLGAPALLFLDVAGLDRTIPRLVSAAQAAKATAGFGPLLLAVGGELTRQGVDLRRSLAPLFAGETAVALLPGADGAAPSPLLLTRVRDQAAARTAMANLQAPAAKAMQRFGGASTTVPAFNQVTVSGIPAYQVQAGGLELDYALRGGRLAISTSLAAVAAGLRAGSPLAARARFRAITRGAPPMVSSELFLDLPALLALGGRTGLAADPTYKALAPDLRRIRAIGLASTGGATDSTTEVSLLIP